MTSALSNLPAAVLGGLLVILVVAGLLLAWARAGTPARLVRWGQWWAAAARHAESARAIALFADIAALGSSTLVTFATASVALLWLLAGDSASALAMVYGSLLGGLGSAQLKRLAGRPRPESPSAVYFGSSFPSSHSAMACACYGTLALTLNDSSPGLPAVAALGQFFCLLVILGVGLSRVVLRVHHVADVVAGWLFGLASVAAAALLRAALPP